MIDELRPVDKTRRMDRLRFGERYLRDCIDKITNKGAFTKRRSKADKEEGNAVDDRTNDEPRVPKAKPHDIDKLI